MSMTPLAAAGQQHSAEVLEVMEIERLREEEHIKARHDERIRVRLAAKRAAAAAASSPLEDASVPAPNQPIMSFSPTTQRILRRAATTPQLSPARKGSGAQPAPAEPSLAPHAASLPSPHAQMALSDSDADLALRIFMGIHGLCLEEEDVAGVFAETTSTPNRAPAAISSAASSTSIASILSSSCYSSDSDSAVSNTHMFSSDCSDAYISSVEDSPRKPIALRSSPSPLPAPPPIASSRLEQEQEPKEQQEPQLPVIRISAIQKPVPSRRVATPSSAASTASSATASPSVSNATSPVPAEEHETAPVLEQGRPSRERQASAVAPVPAMRMLSFRPQRLIRKDLEAGVQEIDKKLDILESEINVLKAKAERALQRENLASFWVQVDELRTHQDLLEAERESLVKRLDEIALEEEEEEEAARNRELVPERWRNRAKRIATRRKMPGADPRDPASDSFSTAGSRAISPVELFGMLEPTDEGATVSQRLADPEDWDLGRSRLCPIPQEAASAPHPGSGSSARPRSKFTPARIVEEAPEAATATSLGMRKEATSRTSETSGPVPAPVKDSDC